MAKSERVARVITANVADFETLVSVKKSIYPWDDLIPQNDDAEDAPTRNFLVGCEDVETARSRIGAIRSSGQNFYMKRRINLVPVTAVVQMSDDSIGVLCTAVAVAPPSD
jgi:hypothetical protein